MSTRVELAITEDYVDWNIAQGIRELIQNAKDAEVEHGAKMNIEHVYRVRGGSKVGALVISNQGVTIKRDALMIGGSSKKDSTNSDLIGHWGEGLKLGLLTLCKFKKELKIRNGSEVWNVSIGKIKGFDTPGLVIEISENHKNESRVQFEILDISLKDWDSIKKNFLFLNDNYPNNIKATNGELILDTNFAGKLYCKGIFVEHNPHFKYGYNFLGPKAKTDRDRQMVENPTNLSSSILIELLNNNKIKSDLFYKLLESNSRDVDCVWYNSFDLTKNSIECLVDAFKKEHGENAHPVENSKEVSILNHYGKKGVVLPYYLRNILFTSMGSVDKLIKEIQTQYKKTYSIDELNENELVNYEKSLTIVTSSLQTLEFEIEILRSILIVDFINDELMGLYKHNSNQILISKKCLTKFSKTLCVLIHEISHHFENDGKIHLEIIESINETIYQLL